MHEKQCLVVVKEISFVDFEDIFTLHHVSLGHIHMKRNGRCSMTRTYIDIERFESLGRSSNSYQISLFLFLSFSFSLSLSLSLYLSIYLSLSLTHYLSLCPSQPKSFIDIICSDELYFNSSRIAQRHTFVKSV